MGGCGGKKQRAKMKASFTGGAVIGGKFDSIGTAVDQQANLALATRLLGEIGTCYEGELLQPEKDFLRDCMIKLNQSGTKTMFGWRQIQRLVEVHKRIIDARKEREGDGSERAGDNNPAGGVIGSGEGEVRSAKEARTIAGRNGEMVKPSGGGVQGSRKGNEDFTLKPQVNFHTKRTHP